MVIIICGSRDWDDEKTIREYLEELKLDHPEIALVVAGGASGADEIGIRLAKEVLGCSILVYHADWKKYGKAAGPIRNEKMAKETNADLVLAFWDGKSPGTHNMIKMAIKYEIPYLIVPPASLD